MAKAIEDNRMLDVPLNPLLYRFMLNKPFTPHDLALVDPQLAQSLTPLQQIADAVTAARGDAAALHALRTEHGNLVSSMYLDFTLPGTPFQMKPAGGVSAASGFCELVAANNENAANGSLDVTVDNLPQYLESLQRITLIDGTATQMEAFCTGVSFFLFFSILCSLLLLS